MNESLKLQHTNAKLLASLKELELFVRVLGLDSPAAASSAAHARSVIAMATASGCPLGARSEAGAPGCNAAEVTSCKFFRECENTKS